jgi:hypothetical protein
MRSRVYKDFKGTVLAVSVSNVEPGKLISGRTLGDRYHSGTPRA